MLVVESLLDDVRAAGKASEKYQQLLVGDDESDGVQRRDGLVYTRDGKLYIPDDRRLRTRLLELAHDAVGHFGRERTLERLQRHCVWAGMSKEVADYCMSCAVCAVVKTSSAMQAGKLTAAAHPGAGVGQRGRRLHRPAASDGSRAQQHHGHHRPADRHADAEDVQHEDRRQRGRQAAAGADAGHGQGCRHPSSATAMCASQARRGDSCGVG